MMEATDTTVQARAAEAADWFESAQRVDGDEETEYVRLKDGRPEWVQEIVFQAHKAYRSPDGFLPDDFRYQATWNALNYIGEGGEDGHEFADEAVDVYTGALLEWLASNLNRVSYCDEAVEELGYGEEKGLMHRVTLGQYWELQEVFGLVLQALEAVDTDA